MSIDPAPSRRATLRRWAAILLPIVIVLRALLLVYQLHSEHQPPQPSPAVAWPPEPGAVLRFRRDDAGIAEWGRGSGRAPITAQLVERDFLPQPPETGCMLEPVTMEGGTLTLVSQEAGGGWLADWHGRATMPSLADAPGATEIHDPEQRRIEAAMLAAADCGSVARLRLEAQAVHVLVNMLAGLPTPPPPDPAPPGHELHIRVQGAPPAALVPPQPPGGPGAEQRQ